MAINPPRQDGDYPDRELDCQMHLEDDLLSLIEDAQQAGWGKTEILNALDQLIPNIRKAHEEDPDPADDP